MPILLTRARARGSACTVAIRDEPGGAAAHRAPGRGTCLAPAGVMVRRSLAALLLAALAAPVSWSHTWWTTRSARRRLRAYGPPARLALGELPRLRTR